MKIADTLLPEFDHEMANTRRALERVPDGRFDYRPNEKAPASGAKYPSEPEEFAGAKPRKLLYLSRV